MYVVQKCVFPPTNCVMVLCLIKSWEIILSLDVKFPTFYLTIPLPGHSSCQICPFIKEKWSKILSPLMLVIIFILYFHVLNYGKLTRIYEIAGRAWGIWRGEHIHRFWWLHRYQLLNKSGLWDLFQVSCDK